MASLLELGVSTGKWDSGLKKAQGSLDKFIQANGGLSNALDKDSEKMGKFVQMMGRMESTAKTGKGQMGDYRKAIEQLTMQYNRMSDAQKKTIGQDYLRAIDQLKAKYHGVSNEMKNISDSLNGMGSGGGKMSGLSSVLGELGGKLGMSSELTGMLTTGTIGMTAAVTAGAAAVGAAAKAWADYNTELAKSQQDVTVITGLKGEDADELTVGLRALVSTYDVDFREAVNAANTIMTQFGVSGETAFDLLRAGMQGMLQGDGPKLLSMIQQYAPAFNDAGVEASQLIAVIQNSEGGLFTEQNMNAIVMGIKNIRLMTDQTSEALAKLGIDGEDMTRKLNEGSMTIFDALKQVAEQLENTSSSSQAAGEVMQQVFGRQGTAAGTKLGEAIASLNLNLEDTKLQTGSVGESLDELVDANMRLEKAMADCFGFDGWTQMSNSIRATLLTTLADVITAVSSVKEELWAAYKLTLSLLPGGSLVNGIMGISGSGGGTSSTGGGGSVGGGGGGVRGIAEAPTAATIPIRLGGGGGGKTKKTKKTGRTGRTGGSHKTTPTEKAQQLVDNALSNYAQTISEADLRMEAGLDDTLAHQKKELQAQQRLYEAYGKAYAIHADQKYKTAYTEAAEKYKSLAKAVKDTETETKKAKEWLKEAEKMTTGVMKTGYTPSIESSTREKVAADNMAADDKTLSNLLEVTIKHGLSNVDIPSDYLADLIFGEGFNVPDEYWKEIVDEINDELENLGIEPIKLDVDTGNITGGAKKVKDGWKDAAEAVQTVGDALQQLEDPGAKVAGIIGQAIANIALGFAQATAQASGGGPFAWIAAIAGGLGTMLSTIAAIKSATAGSYAEGGIVPGNNYSDGLIASVSSGELILNRAQQNSIAGQLTSNQGNGESRPYVDVETIWLGMGHYLKRKGMGEIVTTR